MPVESQYFKVKLTNFITHGPKTLFDQRIDRCSKNSSKIFKIYHRESDRGVKSPNIL